MKAAVEAVAEPIEVALEVLFVKAMEGALDEGFHIGYDCVQPNEHLLVSVETESDRC